MRSRYLARADKNVNRRSLRTVHKSRGTSKEKKHRTVWMIMLNNEYNVRVVSWISPERVKAEGAKIPVA